MSQAKDFVVYARSHAPPPERMWRQFRFDDGSVAEYHPNGWPGGKDAAFGEPGDLWIVVKETP